MLNQNQILKHKPNLVWRDVEDGVVIVSPAGGEVRALNQLGSTIWALLDGTNTSAAILDTLTEQYPAVSKTKLQEDLDLFVNSLLERDMLMTVESNLTD